MDYAVTYWVRHLEASLTSLEKEDPEVLDISDSLENFIALHYTNPATRFPISQGNASRLRCLEDTSCYNELQQAVISTRKQLTFYGEMNKTEIALDLVDAVEEIRTVLERLILANQAPEKLEKHYGSNLFKCSKLSCKFFSNGFSTAEQRDQHLGKHLRPFRCTVAGCPNETIGLPTERELQKHTKDAHGGIRGGDDFPDEDEVSRSLQQNQPAAAAPEPAPVPAQEVPAPENATKAQESQGPNSNNIARAIMGLQTPQSFKRQKREHKCSHCGKVFPRKFNLDSHLHTHSSERPWKCEVCDKAFARESDCKRHMKGHDEGQSFSCPGCGKSFARRDTLANHHKSRAGRRCLGSSQEGSGSQGIQGLLLQ